MIHLERLNEPGILARKKEDWLTQFLGSGKARPQGTNHTYGHPDILKQLLAISHNKCFYCERLLTGQTKEIDHYIEIACDKNKAFEWINLYLSCENCNKKIPHNEIPIQDALNPFMNSDAEIEDHITFVDETIRIKNASALGDQTIRKFKLNSESLGYKRSIFLNQFCKELIEMSDLRLAENRDYTNEEKEKLRSYSYPDHPFSLMFKIIMRKRGSI